MWDALALGLLAGLFLATWGLERLIHHLGQKRR
jgi:hypothetical protein